MRLALDTNAYVDICRGREDAVQPMRGAEHLFLTYVSLAELRAGFLAGTRSRENERNLVRFLNSPRAEVLYPDEQTTFHYARLFHQLKSQGTPIPTNDMWIAALVVQHDLVLLSQDKHFDYLPQLARLR